MENFKSYFGRLEIGCFHRRFTAIVGPNGIENIFIEIIRIW